MSRGLDHTLSHGVRIFPKNTAISFAIDFSRAVVVANLESPIHGAVVHVVRLHIHHRAAVQPIGGQVAGVNVRAPLNPVWIAPLPGL